MSLDGFNHIFVTDVATNTISRYSLDGKEEKTIGGVGWDENQFDRPMGIDAHFGIEIYIADYGNHRIQRFDKTLSFIGSLRTRDNTDPTIRFGYPIDVALSRLGDMYIIDSENRRILKVNSFSRVERIFGSIESGRGQLSIPKRISIGNDDKVYVLEDDRLVIYDLFGTFLYEIGKGILQHANGFFILDTLIFVVTNEGVFTWTTDGNFIGKKTNQEFLGVQSIESYRDIALTKDHLFLLTSSTIHIFHKPS